LNSKPYLIFKKTVLNNKRS